MNKSPTRLLRRSKFSPNNEPSLHYFLLLSQSKQLYLQFLRVLRPLPQSERNMLHQHIRQEFNKAKLRQVYVHSAQAEDIDSQSENGLPLQQNKEIDYKAMEKVMKERIQHAHLELKKLREMVGMSAGASTPGTPPPDAQQQDPDVVPIEDPATQWDYPDKSPYDSD